MGDEMAVERVYPLVGRARWTADAQGVRWLVARDGQRIAAGPGNGATADPVQAMEAALQALREAKDQGGKRPAAEALEKALQTLKQQPRPQSNPEAGPDKPPEQ